MNNGLVIKQLSMCFVHAGGFAAAVNDCELSVMPNEIVGLVGESGSGKSLTALACLGLTPPNCRTSGSIQIAGQEIVGANEARLGTLRGRKIAMIFQNPMTAMNPFFTIGEQMSGVIRRHFSVDTCTAQKSAGTALEQSGLTDAVLNKYPHQMSGGQLQRAMIAMAIACKPDILIADEPSTALDVTVQARILNLLRQLADQGMGILLITHDLGVVAQVADRVAVMYSGSIIEAGSIDSMFSDAAHPYTAGLLRSSPVMGGGKRKLHAIPGVVPDYRQRLCGCSFRDRCAQAQAVCASAQLPQISLAMGHQVSCHFPIRKAVAAVPD